MVSFQSPGAILEADAGASTAPLVVLFERDDGVAVPLLSQLRLAGYDVRAARTPVELFDTLGKQFANLVLVDLGNATASRREFWVALDGQRRGKAIQVMTFRYVQPGSLLDGDFETSAKALADVEVHGAHEFQVLVEGVRQRVPLHGAAAPVNPAAFGAHPALPGGIAPIGAALGVQSPFMMSDPAMAPAHIPGGHPNPYGNGFDPTAALRKGAPAAWPQQQPQPYPQSGFMVPGGYPGEQQQPALQSGWMDPQAGQYAQPGVMGFESPFANPAQANPYAGDQSPFAQPYSMNPFAEPPANDMPMSGPFSDPFGGMGSSVPSTPGGSDAWSSSFSSAPTPLPFNPFGEQSPFFGSDSAPGGDAPFPPHLPNQRPAMNGMNGLFAAEPAQPPTQRHAVPTIADAWIPPESDLEGETGVVPEMAYRAFEQPFEAPFAPAFEPSSAPPVRDRWQEQTAPFDGPPAVSHVRQHEEITARIPTPTRLPAVRPPTPTERALSNVLVEGALLTEQRLDALKGIQQMLASVDMDFKLGELALLFKFLSPDQLLAALLVSRGLVSPQQIAGLGRVKQELSGSGMDYDLETLLAMFHILPPEQLHALRAELS